MAFEQVHPAPPVPPRDGSIDQAITDVDRWLAAWHDAMRRAQAVVRAQTARQARAGSGHHGYRSVPAQRPASADRQAGAAASDGGSARGDAADFESAFQPEDANHEASVAETVAPDASAVTLSHAAAADFRTKSPAPESTTEPAAPALSDDDEQPPSGDAPSAEAEEEALLATLDRHTREAVELKRRWVGPNRSLKDLVEEARRASPAQMAQMRRWRSRS